MSERDHATSNATTPPRPARRPIVRPGPLRRLVFDAITEMIINQDLSPGEHLNEAALAVNLGVSRQPVREALQQLQSEGWVNLRPGQGAFVHEPTAEEIDQLLGVRVILEAESARLAALARTDADVAELRALWQAGMDAVASHDRSRMVKANAELHACVMAVGGNAVLAELGRTVDRRVRWHYTPLAVVRGDDAWEEHAELIRAIEAGEADKAAAIMREHTERTRKVARPDGS